MLTPCEREKKKNVTLDSKHLLLVLLQFNLLSASIESSVKGQFANLAEASRACSRLVTQEGQANKYNWPLATISSFELYADEARERARIASLMFLPVVTDLPPFNDYMQQHQDEWVDTARQLQGSLNNVPIETEPYNFEPAVFDVINGGWVTTQPNQGPYMPVWQWSPPPSSADDATTAGLPIGKENFGTLDHESTLIQASSDNKGTCVCVRREKRRWLCPLTLSYINNRLCTWTHGPRLPKHVDSFDWFQPFRGHEPRDRRPSVATHNLCSTHYGYLGRQRSRRRTPRGSCGHELVLVQFATQWSQGYYHGGCQYVWRGTFILVARRQGKQLQSIVCTMLNTPIMGRRDTPVMNSTVWLIHFVRVLLQAIYLGAGDLSEPAFRNRARIFGVQGAPNSVTDPDDFETTEEYCSYKFIITPTQEYEDSFDSNNTMFYTLIVIGIFAVTAFAFFIYDFIVQRRNSLVLQTAAKFNTIVSSLFPSNIRGRLFADKEKDYMEYTTAKSHLKNFLTKGDIDMNGEGDEDDDGLILKTKPMADLFTDTTIMFADVRRVSSAWSTTQHELFNFTLTLSLHYRLLALQLGPRFASLPRCLFFSKPCIEASIRLPRNVGYSRSRQLVTVMLRWLDYPILAKTMPW